MLACIIVTYDPDLHILKRLLEALPEDAAVVLVDNASAGDLPDEIGKLAATRRRTRLLVNDCNL
ncbi:MAG TPA: glycosyltransferase family 2 protein, partial [Chromatiales bacterium]|nr:glycosyltransferase family 2 protein [Chromatiales bacterium]